MAHADEWISDGARESSDLQSYLRGAPSWLAQSPHQRPYSSALALQGLILVIAVLLGTSNTSFLEQFAAPDPRHALETLWQVQAAFVSLAFAGLAILLQLGTESAVTGRSLRAALFEWTNFRFMFAYSSIGLVQTGAVATWFPSDGALISEFALSGAATVLLVAFAYHRAAKVYIDPLSAREMAIRHLEEVAITSVESDRRFDVANSALRAAAPELFDSKPSMLESLSPLVASPERAVLTDINTRRVHQALSIANRASAANAVPGAVPTRRPTLRIRVLMGGESGPGKPVFELHHSGLSRDQLEQIDSELSRGIRWERHA